MIVGIDEVGRGSLAGPVVSACVGFKNIDDIPEGLKDSKKLSAKKRDELFVIIKEKSIVSIGVSMPREIDEINILQATFVSMHRALDSFTGVIEEILVDGNQFVDWNQIPYKTIIKGDQIIPEIMAASIIAKVSRDKFMEFIDTQWAWHKNKGYGTKEHIELIKEHGLSSHHRKTFTTKWQ